MRAVLTVGHGDRSKLVHRTDYPDPVPGPGEVVIRVAASAVNYHDIFTRRGMPGITIPLPVVVGSDFAGAITATGAGVDAWAVGDRVLVDPIIRDGKRVIFDHQPSADDRRKVKATIKIIVLNALKISAAIFFVISKSLKIKRIG